MEPITPKTPSNVQSVDRALLIIDLLAEHRDGLGITELGSLLGVAKSTAHRLISSLKAKGYVKQDPVTEKYHLGLKFLEISSIVSESLEIRTIAHPFMERLVAETGETAHLVILEDGEISYIDKLEAPNTIRMFSRIGKRAPVHCTGAGKAILAHLPERQVEQIVADRGLTVYTEKTVKDLPELLERLELIRSRGYSIDDEEHELGIRCVAAPIFDHRGKVVAGLSVAGPLMRMTEDRMTQCVEHVTFYAREISKKIGFRA
ncbi:MAG TPA: IclR family transcriptional regulator [Bacilli bacterium]|nr:IclR family transcriptional regulator [Bacilli bacterium]